LRTGALAALCEESQNQFFGFTILFGSPEASPNPNRADKKLQKIRYSPEAAHE
jgi:hypothetical protein